MKTSEQSAIEFRFGYYENREGLVALIIPWSGTNIRDCRTLADDFDQLENIRWPVLKETFKSFW